MPPQSPPPPAGVAITDFAVSSPRPHIRRRQTAPYSPRATPAPSIWTPSRPASPTTDPTTYEVSDLRDGFFDAFFLPPPPPRSSSSSELRKTLPERFDSLHPLSVSDFIPRQIHGLRSAVRSVATTRAGARLARSFTAFFVAYVLCLIPTVRAWLGRYAYIVCVSVLVNHPGRTVGAQLDGTLVTILGTALGLGWGALGLLLSTSTAEAGYGYGGILTLFMAIFVTAAAVVRSTWIRFHQTVLCGGLAICYACLAESNGETVLWSKLLDYAIPWLIGQAIALVVNLLVFPDAGARPLAQALHEAFKEMDAALVLPRPRNTRLRRRLAKTFVDLSTAYRDMRIELTIMRFDPHDVRALRNLMQAVLRALLAMKTETKLFDNRDRDRDDMLTRQTSFNSVDDWARGLRMDMAGTDGERAMRVVIRKLGDPTRDLLAVMRESLQRCDAGLMDLSGYRKWFGPEPDVSSDVDGLSARIRGAMAAFDAAEAMLLDSDELPTINAQKPEVVKLFVFARHIRLAATAIEALAAKVHEMQFGSSDRPRAHLPTYPLRKALKRTNAQVRHDRGGVTAGLYHMTFNEIFGLVKNIRSKDHEPLPRDADGNIDDDLIDESDVSTAAAAASTAMTAEEQAEAAGGKTLKRLWKTMHRLQGFESRYALKVVVLTAALSIPAWLDESRSWWNRYEVWWATSMGWMMSHPRVGGNVSDLVTRASAAVLGAVWAGAGYAAGGGNPFAMAAFMVVYMVPMMYRYTLSIHPRSGIVGCLSFTVISLSLLTNEPSAPDSSPALHAAVQGAAFTVGVVGAIVINWVLWPFVARHELRKALSAMLFFQSIIYRGVVAKYIYYEEGHDPTPEDVERSEMLEGRLREGFVRIHQLLSMTRHEIRLRAPFDPVPYSALADACERFFEYLVAVRQSALFHSHELVRSGRDAAFGRLLECRRDAVAAILCNLYILAGALRSQRKVPAYLPSAIAARQRLLDKMAEVQDELDELESDDDESSSSSSSSDDVSQQGGESSSTVPRRAKNKEIKLERIATKKRQSRWAEVYRYSYNEALTGCASQLEALEKYTKLVVGESGFGGQLLPSGQEQAALLFNMGK